eukprot:10098506-Prorocentrum_lima.AAC.1
MHQFSQDNFENAQVPSQCAQKRVRDAWANSLPRPTPNRPNYLSPESGPPTLQEKGITEQIKMCSRSGNTQQRKT